MKPSPKCRCGKLATVTLTAGGSEVSCCDQCWDRAVQRLTEVCPQQKGRKR